MTAPWDIDFGSFVVLHQLFVIIKAKSVLLSRGGIVTLSVTAFMAVAGFGLVTLSVDLSIASAPAKAGADQVPLPLMFQLTQRVNAA